MGFRGRLGENAARDEDCEQNNFLHERSPLLGELVNKKASMRNTEAVKSFMW